MSSLQLSQPGSGPSRSSRSESSPASSGSPWRPTDVSRSWSGPRCPRRRAWSESGSSATTVPEVRDGPADLLEAARLAARSDHLELLGLHAFGASNVLDAGAIVAHVAATGTLARDLAAATGTPIRIVDAGGGLGIAYESHEESVDLRAAEARSGERRHRLE